MGFHSLVIPALVQLVREHQHRGMVVAEIGCYDGSTAEHWLPIVSAQQGIAILVDNFRGSPGVADQHGEKGYDAKSVQERLALRVRPFTNVAILNGDSVAMARLVSDRVLDICFLDADHRYSHIAGDINAWRPKVKLGGLLCGHDCESMAWDERFVEMDYQAGNHHGVAKAIAERFARVRLIADAVWVAESAPED